VSATGDLPYWLWAAIPYTAVLVIVAAAAIARPDYLPLMLRDPYQYTKDLAASFWPAAANWQPQTAFDRWYDRVLTASQPLWQIVGALVGAFVFMMTAQLVHLLFMAGIPRMLRSNPLGFGQETILDNVLAVIDVTDMPQGVAAEQQHYAFPHGGLHHSALYDDGDVLRDVAAWIARADRRRGA
jgi:hypothetical protein